MRLQQRKTDVQDAGTAKEQSYHRFIVYIVDTRRALHEWKHWMKKRECLASRYDDDGAPIPCQENTIVGIGKEALLEMFRNGNKADDIAIPSESAFDIWVPEQYLRELADIQENGIRDRNIMRTIIVNVEYPTSQKIPFGMGKLGFKPHELEPASKAESRLYAKPSVVSGSTTGRDTQSLANGGKETLRIVKSEWKSNSGFKKAEKVKQTQFPQTCQAYLASFFACVRDNETCNCG